MSQSLKENGLEFIEFFRFSRFFGDVALDFIFVSVS